MGFSSLSRHVSQKSIPVQHLHEQGCWTRLLHFTGALWLNKHRSVKLGQKRRKELFFFPQTQLFSATINPLHRCLSEIYISAHTQLQAERLHQVTTESLKATQQGTQHCTRGRVAELHFFPPKVNPVQESYMQSDWQWQMTYLKKILFVCSQSQMLPIILSFLPYSLISALLARHPTTDFAAEICRMLPFGYDEDLYSSSSVEITQL